LSGGISNKSVIRLKSNNVTPQFSLPKFLGLLRYWWQSYPRSSNIAMNKADVWKYAFQTPVDQ